MKFESTIGSKDDIGNFAQTPAMIAQRDLEMREKMESAPDTNYTNVGFYQHDTLDPNWRSKGECRGKASEFIIERLRSNNAKDRIKNALALCNICEVKEICENQAEPDKLVHKVEGGRLIKKSKNQN